MSYDPHGGPPPPVYAGAHRLAEDVSRYVMNGAVLRFGVVEDWTPETLHDTATVSINGVWMPYLINCSPSIGEKVAWLQMEDNRVCIGAYGTDLPRVKSWLSTGVSVAPSTFDIYFDGNSTTDHQWVFDHSTSFFPYLFSPTKRGYYDVYGGISFAPGDGNIRALGLKQNGTAIWSKVTSDCNPLFGTSINFCIPINLEAGDTLSLYGIHNASGNLNLDIGWATTYFAAAYRASWPV